MARRNSRHLRARAADLRRRRSNGLRNMGMAIVALLALLALGGQFASGAAGCFSSITGNPSAPLEVGGTDRGAAEPDETPSSGGVRIQVKTTPVSMPVESDARP